ncbi:lipoprotein N-acyltransferase Lnb domain-containing protein [Pedobacter lusitanus]|uniref:lipoprotein N-acyltransferase Lnb domain-containing protein n=1 Tax=Pedobacter lusitanus TaxID=1503925 RepID=UPI000698342A|nr:DUF4105 domain-containing protein [Pedobacter lusitanus]
MQKYLIILLVLLLYQNTFAASIDLKNQTSLLSDKAAVSVLTCGKTSKYLYALFGHSAIRITDEERQIDQVYNYGTFDNDDPDFYINFINGRMKYSLSVSDYQSFLQEYIINGQSVVAQKLKLTLQEKNKLFSLLKEEIKPANKYYYYDFVRNNCATKIVDLLAKTLGPDFDHALSEINKGRGNTIRDLISKYLTADDHYMIGMNLLLGKKTDVVSARSVSLFLPDTLHKRLDHMQLRKMKFTEPAVFLFIPYQDQANAPDFIKGTLYGLSLIFLISGQLSKDKVGYLNKLITMTVFTVISLAGFFLLYLSVFSSLELVKYNLSILWCHPLYLLLAFEKLRKPAAIIFLISIFLYILCYFNAMSFPVLLPVLLLLIVILVFQIQQQKTSSLSPD